MPRRSRRAFVACMGDANDPDAWSAIPYHFLHAGRRCGIFDAGLSLRPDARAHAVRRLAWNLGQVLRGDRRGGYQYSVRFLESLWTPVRRDVAGAAVVNNFQLYPPSAVADPSIQKWFYLDGTLTDLMGYYGMAPRVGRRIMTDALARERAGYHAAAGVVAMSAFTADGVVRDYGVPRDRVHVVVPGANLTAEEYARWEQAALAQREAETGRPLGGTADEKGEPLRLVMVGKDWRRKGLDRLLRAIALARPRGLRATLRVIGCSRQSLPPELRDVAGVEWMGFLPRRPDGRRLFELIAACDVGCLLSRAEFAGIALREYLAFGLVVLGSDTGGSPDQLVPEASIAIRPDAGDEEISRVLLRLENDREKYDAMKLAAWRHRRTALWDVSAEQFARLMAARRDE